MKEKSKSKLIKKLELQLKACSQNPKLCDNLKKRITTLKNTGK